MVVLGCTPKLKQLKQINDVFADDYGSDFLTSKFFREIR
jgi:hypothetical protein